MKADKSAVIIESSEESEMPVTGSNKGNYNFKIQGLGEMNLSMNLDYDDES